MHSYSKIGFHRAPRIVLLSSLLLVMSCSPAFAQDHETWRCDTPNGSYDVNSSPISDKATSISGRIDFHKGDFGPDFGSIVRIGFEDSTLENSGCHCNGVFVEGFQNPDRVGFYVLVDGKTELFDQARTIDTPITFRIAIDPHGMMTVQVGKEHLETKTVVLPHPARDTVIMSCSGADVSFLNLSTQ